MAFRLALETNHLSLGVARYLIVLKSKAPRQETLE